jgi:hypothetical protein
MSPVMVAPLVALAVLLVLPGGMPEERVATAPAARVAVASPVSRSLHLALGTGEKVVKWLLHVP